MRRAQSRRWIEAEIAQLDAARDRDRIMLLSTNRMLPRLGREMVMNLLYTLGFMRVSGQLEGARVVDAVGKVHRAGDRRAADTIGHFSLWLAEGPDSARGRASLKEVRGIHDRVAAGHPFTNETMVHTICLFAVQFQQLLELIGAPGYSEIEKQAQVLHWLAVGQQLGAREMPETWEAMIQFLEWYEASPQWFGPSVAGRRCARALIAQFGERRLPPGLRWAASPLTSSLLPEHVARALDLRPPPRPVVASIRGGLRHGIAIERVLLGDPRQLVDPSVLVEPASP